MHISCCVPVSAVPRCDHTDMYCPLKHILKRMSTQCEGHEQVTCKHLNRWRIQHGANLKHRGFATTSAVFFIHSFSCMYMHNTHTHTWTLEVWRTTYWIWLDRGKPWVKINKLNSLRHFNLHCLTFSPSSDLSSNQLVQYFSLNLSLLVTNLECRILSRAPSISSEIR